MKIGIDLDEVLTDFLAAVTTFHNEKYGSDLKPRDFHSYRFEDVWGGTEDEAVEKVLAFFHTDHFKELKPKPDAVKAIERLGREGHELFIITGRQYAIAAHTEEWLAKHFPNAFHEVHFANTYGLTGVKRSKGEICKELQIRLFIEDGIPYATNVAALGIPVLLLDRPWNQAELPAGITRVHDWGEILCEIGSRQ